ncbi:MAG: YlbF family regulator [Bacillales bacterium]|jgi:cell fate (sporulation/competence/biofilm development) regulator YlbF (YheA/YmcA/DUF963 family)|nr:YlbF family regulator [Bacillales bacterium]
MIFSTEILEIENKCEEVISVIINSEIFSEYKYAKENLINDEEAIELVKKFSELKEKYEEVQRFGKYHPDYTVIRKEMSEMKKLIDSNESITNFKKNEKNLQLLLNEIGVIIAESVSSNVKVVTENSLHSKGCSCNSNKQGCSCK